MIVRKLLVAIVASAQLAGCAARTAPRTISSVTASQAVGAFLREASGIRAILQLFTITSISVGPSPALARASAPCVVW